MTADGFAGNLGSGEEEYAARMGVDRFTPTDDREAQDVEALTRSVHAALLVEHFGEHPPHDAYKHPQSDMGWQARRIAERIAPDVAARERAAAEKALGDAAQEARERGDIGRPDQVEVWDWLDHRAARIARSQP